MIMTRDETFQIVRGCLADSLAIKPDQIALHSRLIADLGADSLDFLDILFMLEKKFGVKMQEKEFDFLARLDFSSPAVMRDGFLTEETVANLVPWLPALRQVSDRDRVTPGRLFSLITVETLCVMVEQKGAAPGP